MKTLPFLVTLGLFSSLTAFADNMYLTNPQCQKAIQEKINAEGKALGVNFGDLDKETTLSEENDYKTIQSRTIQSPTKEVKLDESVFVGSNKKKNIAVAKKCKPATKSVAAVKIRKLQTNSSSGGPKAVKDVAYNDGYEGFEVTFEGCLFEKNQSVAQKKFVFFAAHKDCPVSVAIKKPAYDDKHKHQMELVADYRACQPPDGEPQAYGKLNDPTGKRRPAQKIRSKAYGLNHYSYLTGQCNDDKSRDYDSYICKETQAEYDAAIEASNALCEDIDEDRRKIASYIQTRDNVTPGTDTPTFISGASLE